MTDQDQSQEANGSAPGFKQAMAELETILRRIEDDDIDIDELADELRTASRLLEVCREKIKRAEVEISQVVENLE